MEDTDESEARAFASEWVKNITAKVGLASTEAERNSRKQVHGNDDEIDKNEHKCINAANKHGSYNNFRSSNGDELSECSSSSTIRYAEKYRPEYVLNTYRQEDCTKNGVEISDSKLLNNIPLGVVDASNPVFHEFRPNFIASSAEKVAMPSLQGPSPTNDELYALWDFDEQQKQKAEHYLRGAGMDDASKKENLPPIDSKFGDRKEEAEKQTSKTKSSFLEKQPSDWVSDVIQNDNFCKICPDCKEQNHASANWCEECGKALITVEAAVVEARLKAKPAVNTQGSVLDSEGNQTKKNSVLISKLNPNCAEFVSAYSQTTRKTSPMRVLNGKSSNHLNYDFYEQTPDFADQVSYLNGEKTKQDYASKSYQRVSDEKSWNDFKSNSFTESFKGEHKKDKKNKRTKQNRNNRRRSASFEYESHSPFAHHFAQSSLNNLTAQYSHSFSPRNECFNSPVNTFVGYNGINEQPMPYHTTGSSPQVYGMPMVPRYYDCNEMQGTHSSLDSGLSAKNQNEIGSFSRLNGAGNFQGFDFQNPQLDNPHVFGASNNFDETEFSRSFVQNALHEQVEFFYGPANPQHQAYVSQNGDFTLYQPAFVYVDHPLKTDLPRAYEKKKFAKNGIKSPRVSKELLKNSKSSQQKKMTYKRSHKAKNSPEWLSSNACPNGANANDSQNEQSKFSSEVAIPPLKLDDLDNYDQVLTLIRTSREEALPYLCLPEEIILYIFSYLTTSDLCHCARVCHQFYRISVDESLWKEITIKKRRDLSDETLRQVAKRCPVSLTITQCHSKLVTEQGIRSLFQACGENLLDLDFSACSGNALVGELILLHVSTRCHNLRSLDISWSNVSDIGIQAVCEAVTRLECLCMNGCQAITDEATRCVANRHGESLRVLEIFGCFNITQLSLTILKDNCPNMETLNIGQCHKISDSAVSEFVKKARKLENIDLRGCKQMRDNAIKVLASNCPNLSTLVIANCPFITDASLLAIATGLSNVRCIDVCGCPKVTDKGIQALAKSCSKLQILDLSSTKASDKAVMSLANYCFKTLESLKMSFCLKITEISLEHLAKKCNRLKMLHLYGCRRIKSLTRVQNCRETLKIET